MASNLISTTNKVEIPYITVQIGQYSFGVYNKTKTNLAINGKYYEAIKVTYPNYVKSLIVNKVNGTLNNYTLTMEYQINENSDPNLIDKVFSSVSKSRKIIFTYGDCATPTFMYKNEEALITKVTKSLDISSSKINYVVTAVSSSLGLKAGVYNFPRYKSKKPSDIIKSLLSNKSYGLQEIFYGMHDLNQVNQLGLILADDREVAIEPKQSITIIDYLNYLVSCMSSNNDKVNDIKKSSIYVLTIHDDTSNVLDGPYFKISKVESDVQLDSSIDYYTIDIGYPNKDLVVNFNVDDNQAYSILYEYSDKLDLSEYVYRINDKGGMEEIYSPTLTNSREYQKTTASDRTWWSQMTQFPITATLTIKGLLRAAILMSYIRINIYMFGKKYNASGIYVITKQQDEISEQGYRTTLSLARVKGDDI